MSVKQKEHNCCCPCSLEREESHFTSYLFHYRKKGTSSAAHTTHFLLSLYTTKRRHWSKSFSCIVSERNAKCEAGSILPFKVLSSLRLLIVPLVLTLEQIDCIFSPWMGQHLPLHPWEGRHDWKSGFFFFFLQRP